MKTPIPLGDKVIILGGNYYILKMGNGDEAGEQESEGVRE
ncbi:hypothetical protein NSTCB13_06630 [Nostoc sp. DSM 114160]|jgi:hypothetical protein